METPLNRPNAPTSSQPPEPSRASGSDPAEKLWDVRKIDGVLGVGRLLGQVTAIDLASAEELARAAYPAERELLVCLALRDRARRRRSRSTLGDL